MFQMRTIIAILDDEPDRLAAMIPLLRRRFKSLSAETFDNAPDMIAWLKDHLCECVLLCLDHDLGPNRRRAGRPFDPGIGRDVVDYLATCEPCCPVVVHTTNSEAAPGMLTALRESGWTAAQVVPYEDVLWIREVWIDEVIKRLKVD